MILPGLITLIVITLFFYSVRQYRILGDNLLKQEINRQDRITLTALSGDDSWKEFRFPGIDRLYPMMIVIKLEASLNDVRPDRLAWQVARADFKFFDYHRHELRKFRYNVMSAAGSRNWRKYSRSFFIPASAWGGVLFLHNAGSAGTVVFSDIEVFPAAASPYFELGKWLMLGLWIAVFLFYLNKLRKWWLERRSSILPLLFAFLFLAMFLMAVLVSESIMDGLWSRLVWLPDRETVKGWGHFLIFFVLTIISLKKFADRRYSPENANVLPPSGWKMLLVTLYLLLLAWASEVLQFFSSSRFPSFSDWLDDAVGIFLGLAVYTISSRLSARIENRRRKRFQC